MNENNNYNYYNEDMEINLVDLMFYLLRQWKTLLLAIVIGAILGVGIYTIKKPDPVPEVDELTEEELAPAEERYEVTPDEVANMELAYQYRRLYKNQLEYNQKSIIMQLDPNAIYTGELKYYISAGYDTGLISILYQNVLSDKNLLADLKEAADLDCEEPYMKELVSCSINQDGESTININNMLEALSESANNVNRSAVITYTVISTSETSCDQMLEVIRERVNALSQECAETYDHYSSQEVNDAVRLVTNNDYLNKQKANIDQLNTYLSNVQRLENAFSEDAKAYYNEVYLAREIEEDDEEIIPLDTDLETFSENPVKWVIIGIFLLCVCWGGFYLLRYLFDRHVKSAEELQKRYSLHILGRLETGDKLEKGINRWLSDLQRKSKGSPDTLDYITAAIQALDAKKLLLCIEQGCGQLTKVSEAVQSACNDVQVGNMVHLDKMALEVAKGMDGVILTAVVGHTDQKEIRRELDVCRLQGIPVFGVIVVE